MFRDGITHHDRRPLSPMPGEPPSGELQPDQHQAVGKAPLGFVVGRLLDAFDSMQAACPLCNTPAIFVSLARYRGAWAAAMMSSCISARSNAQGCMGSMRDKRSLSTSSLIQGQASRWRIIYALSNRQREEP